MFYEFYIFFKCQIYKNGMGKTKIGLDQSINSTSVCVLEEGKKPVYYIITPKLTKKQSAANHDRICYITYDKINSNLNHNIRCISEKISQIIANKLSNTKDIEVRMEDVALMAKGRSIIDLSILNGYIRCELDKLGVNYKTIPPTQWKKELLGNGAANKDVIIYNWSKLDSDAYNQVKDVKCDDVADSYFIANI